MPAGRSRIFSINADGSGRRQLASGKARLLPTLSPGGHWILFARGRWPCWLYVMRSDGTHETRLAQASFGYYDPPDGLPYEASWSPDAKRIAFVRGFAKHDAYGSAQNPRSAIYVINIDGTGLRRLTPPRRSVETTSPAWSPDGHNIAFVEHSCTATNCFDRHYVMRADGTNVKWLKQLDGTYWFWLPNGRIAYDEGDRSGSIDADGTGKPQPLPGRIRLGDDLWITSGRSAGFYPVSPDGKWIALYTGRRNLWIAHLDGTHRRLVTRKICCSFGSAAVGWAGR